MHLNRSVLPLQQKSDNLRFSSLLAFDLGTSDPKHGHLRVTLQNDKGDTLGLFDGKACPNGINNQSNLIKHITDKLVDIYTTYRAALPVKDELKGIVGFVPGVVINQHQVAGFGNILSAGQAKPQHIIDFSTLPKQFAKQAKQSVTLPLILSNDVMGSTLGIVQQVKTHYADKYVPGLHGLCIITGGGIGVAEFRHLGQELVINTGELGSQKSWHTPQISVNAAVGNSRIMLKHFAEMLNLPADQLERSADFKLELIR